MVISLSSFRDEKLKESNKQVIIELNEIT